MKFYIKLFILSFLGFVLLFSGALFAFDYFSGEDNGTPVITSSAPDETVSESTAPEETTEPLEADNRTELQKLADASSRINILAFGLNDSLADTIMLFSYDPEKQKMDIVSIPRDTYHHVEGFNGAGQKKINAVYGFKGEGGSNGMKRYISEFLGVPIDYYVRVNFNSVIAVVDTLGGYPVTVPFDMDYDDPYGKPALHVHLKKGYQVLDGDKAVGYLRFRKNNSGTISEGDIQRIARQQHFVKTMIDKALSSKLPTLINTIIGGKYVRTDMTLEQALTFAIQGASIKGEDIQFYMLEGHDKMIGKTSYWIHDAKALEKLMFKIYGHDLDAAEHPSENASEDTTEPTTR